MRKISKIKAVAFALFLIIVSLIIVLIPKIEKEYVYKIEYSEFVEKYAEETGLDKYFVYAVIKTSYNFV